MTRRILLGVLVFTVVVLTVLVIPLGLANARRQRAEAAAQLEREAFVIASLVEEHMEVLQPAEVRRVVRDSSRRSRESVTILDVGGRVVTSDDASMAVGTRVRTPEVRAAERATVGTDRRGDDGPERLYVAVPVNSGGRLRGVVQVSDQTAAVDQRITEYWTRLAVVSLAATGLAALIGLVIARSIARPLAEVEETAEELAAGHLGARAPVTGPAEVRALAGTLNVMAGRLSALLASQEAFVADASHQLRTPLTALRLRLENIETDQAGDAGDDATAALREVDRLSRIVDGLLALARVDRDVAPAQGVIDLRDLLAEARATWEPIAEDQDVSLVDESGDDPLLAVASADRVGQVLDNLVTNAIDASPPGAVVSLAAQASDGVVRVHVTDHGVGLSASDRTRAFDRFWRANRTPSPTELGGTGLGLAIVQKLAHADGASVVLEETTGGGIDAVVTYRRVEPGS